MGPDRHRTDRHRIVGQLRERPVRDALRPDRRHCIAAARGSVARHGRKCSRDNHHHAGIPHRDGDTRRRQDQYHTACARSPSGRDGVQPGPFRLCLGGHAHALHSELDGSIAGSRGLPVRKDLGAVQTALFYALPAPFQVMAALGKTGRSADNDRKKNDCKTCCAPRNRYILFRTAGPGKRARGLPKSWPLNAAHLAQQRERR